MKFTLLIIIALSTISKGHTQDIAGYDQYRDYKRIYIDNLLQEYFPNNLHDLDQDRYLHEIGHVLGLADFATLHNFLRARFIGDVANGNDL